MLVIFAGLGWMIIFIPLYMAWGTVIGIMGLTYTLVMLSFLGAFAVFIIAAMLIAPESTVDFMDNCFGTGDAE